jgi:hypothetical protein
MLSGTMKPPPEPQLSSTPVELRWQVWLPWLALATILITATGTDPDLWGHARFGLDFLRTGELPSVDPYSFTQDKPWVNHEWLSETLMGIAFRIGATAGLVILKALVIGCAAGVVWWRSRESSPLVAASVTTLAIVGGLPVSGTVRPQIWSVLGLALLVPLLDCEKPTWRRMVAAGALFGVWANMHGGWITGGAALAVHAVLRAARSPRQAVVWMSLGAICLLATLANPYGITLWQFLASTVRSTRPDIWEWAPFTFREPLIMWVSVVGPLALFGLLLLKRDARPSLETSAVLLVLVAGGVRVSRVAPLVCPACFALLAPCVTRAWGGRAVLTAPSAPAALVLLLPSLFTIVAARAPVTRSLTCLPIDDPWAPDRLAAAQLRGSSGKLWNTFDWGEYAIWHFGPALKVSIDGRRETVYSDNVGELNRSAESGEREAVIRMLARRPDYVWLRLERLSVLSPFLSPDYRIDVKTNESFIAVRRELPALPTNVAALPACFP